MQSSQPQFAVKLLPSLTDFAFLLPAAFLFGRMEGVKTLLSDCDTGWHIRTGEWILSNHQVPVRDFFSFTKAGETWYAWEWLSDVLFAWLSSRGGLAAVVLASILLLAVTFALLFRLARRGANPVVAFLVTLVAAATSSIHWLARPHLFSLVFLVLFYGALERIRSGSIRFHGVPYLAILPVATILWTNLHGGFFIGIVMILAYGAGDALKAALAPDRSRVAPELARARNYFLSAVACLAASLLNPYTYHLHQHVLEYLGDPYQSQHIVEFLSVSFHHPVAIFFEALLLAGAGAAFWNVTRGSYTEGLLLLIWAHAGLLASRNLPLYAIVATPIIASAMDAWLHRLPAMEVAGWLRRISARVLAIAAETSETDAVPRWHLASIAGILAIAALLYAPAPPRRFRAEYDPKSYPAGAVALLRNIPSARIFTNDEWGDYLIYRLYPRTRVFVDGRSDFYGDSFEQKYLDVMNVKYGWEKTLSHFGIDTILLPPDAAFAGALKESNRWRVVYDDGVALIFRPSRQSAGDTISTTLPGEGTGRDREVTKTQMRDQAITDTKTKT
ncbi:MAG: hypothetical protein C5B51_06320 [Terriglobia bacterium]|nr:MAG: hypothetical protein C5B51_06320 [Terriglobia bacterium]